MSVLFGTSGWCCFCFPPPHKLSCWMCVWSRSDRVQAVAVEPRAHSSPPAQPWLTLWSSRCLGSQTARRASCWCWGAACRTSSPTCCWPRERWGPEECCHPLDHHVVHVSSFWSLVLYFYFLKVYYLQSYSYFCACISAPREWFYTSVRWVQ